MLWYGMSTYKCVRLTDSEETRPQKKKRMEEEGSIGKKIQLPSIYWLCPVPLGYRHCYVHQERNGPKFGIPTF
jgi:hypothetical protein